MIRKIFYLIAALAFPIAIFLFLKFFGRNEFAVEPLYQTSLPSTACDYNYTLPYVVPDSVLTALIPAETGLAVVIFMGKEKSAEADRLIRRLASLFGEDSVSFHAMDESIVGSKYGTLRECVFFLTQSMSVALIDGKGRIRGQYDAASMEEADRLIVEMKIILSKF